MIGVDEMEDIRKRARGGESIASIARAVGASEPTVGKYAGMKDLSPEPPRRREPESEVLAPYEETIDSRPAGGCGNWRKQRHTATRAAPPVPGRGPHDQTAQFLMRTQLKF
jgi:transposase